MGTTVGKIMAQDGDIGINAKMTYSLEEDPEENSTFIIQTDPATQEGVILLAKVNTPHAPTSNFERGSLKGASVYPASPILAVGDALQPWLASRLREGKPTPKTDVLGPRRVTAAQRNYVMETIETTTTNHTAKHIWGV